MRKHICERFALDGPGNKPVIMLLGNKCDLEHFREMDTEAGKVIKAKQCLKEYISLFSV